MYKIEVRVSFRSAHRLLPPYKGHCNHVHGEYYTAIFVFGSKTLDTNGMVFDFGTVKKMLKTWIDEHLDHAYICNKKDDVGVYLEDKGFRVYKIDSNPTAENLAQLLFNLCIKLNIPAVKVGVVESSPDSIAWYEKGS